ncbi:MAG: NAD-dependent epimerase/dehydratase family protein [bacterium]
MSKKILVTGGAGFVGSHLVDTLVAKGHTVRVLDNLDPQVHGKDQCIPLHLNKECELIKGDVRDKDIFRKAIKGIEVIFHEAAAVGVGQSMYQVEHYMSTNTMGTAILLDLLINEKHSVEKILVASSMSIYGEGAYLCMDCGQKEVELRSEEQLKRQDWEMFCPLCKQKMRAIPTTEEKPLRPTSIYAISKKDQEEMCINIGIAYRLPTVALRYFNIYGTRQSLNNPYTGVAAIFSSRLLNKNPPLIFEDGLQRRDFIHVSDIVRANILCMERDEANYQIFNVGTGQPKTVLEIANILAERLGIDIQPEIVNKFRAGDIRHCYSESLKIKERLGFEPKVKFQDGIGDLINWVKKQKTIDLVEKARRELEEKGLTG